MTPVWETGADLSTLRLRRQNLLTGCPLDLDRADIRDAVQRRAADARRMLGSLRSFGADRLPWRDLDDHHHIIGLHTSFTRLADVVLACCTPGSDLAEDTGLRDRVLEVLEGLLRCHYNVGQRERLDLWWHREYGIPLALVDILTLLDGSATEGLRDLAGRTILHFLPDATHMMHSDQRPRKLSTGANRMWQVTIHAALGSLLDQPAMLTAASAARSNVFGYTASGDGFHTDGSFIQHDRHPYNGGYGRSLLTLVAKQASWLRGTAWALTADEWQILGQRVDESYVPFVFRGGIVDMVRGREIARPRNDPHIGGHEIAAAMLELAEGVDGPAARRWRAIVAEWITSDTSRDFWSTAPLRALMLAAQLDEGRVQPLGRVEPDVCRVYPAMDRALLKGERFAFTVSMHSSRIAAYECISQVNPRGWYTAAGMTQLHNGDVGQFSEGYWATVDHHRLPGVTRVMRELPEELGADACGTKHWVGGVSCAGVAAVGMDLEFPPPTAAAGTPTITGKKSWFLFGGVLACLGSNIGTSDGSTAETIIDSRRLTAVQHQCIEINGAPWVIEPGAKENGTIRSVHLSHPATGADIGYLLPGDGTARAEVAARHGRWSQVNPRELDADQAELSATYVTLSVDHGAPAGDGAYSYLILPGISAAGLEALAGDPPVSVLEQSEVAHAVRCGDVTAINFWQGGGASVAGVQANAAVSVLLIDRDERLTLAVADPTQSQDSVELLLTVPGVGAVDSSDPRVRAVVTGASHTVTVDLAQSAGRTIEMTLGRRRSRTVTDEAVRNA